MKPERTDRLETVHTLLTHASDMADARHNVLKFINSTDLVHYDQVKIVEEKVFRADLPEFWKAVEEGVNTNSYVCQQLLKELALQGFNSLMDLAQLPRGYLSKILHTVAHLLDGFFGIDSCFYNLPEDSHQV